MKYNIQNQEIELELSNKVFSPSLHGSSALGENIKINEGESVLDMGAGTGLLAILATKLGGRVTAIDILSEAVELSQKNSERNKVSIEIRAGNLFEPVRGEKFDVIIANIPQENLSPKIIESLSKEAVTGMHGGKNGNELLLKVLKSAPNFMHSGSRLYIVVYSMSSFRESLKLMLENYRAKLINFHSGPVKDFLYDDVSWYEKQSENGLIGIYKKSDKYYADLFVFELSLR